MRDAVLRLKEILKLKTQTYVAKELGVSLTTIYKWDQGVSEPSKSNLEKIDKLYKEIVK